MLDLITQKDIYIRQVIDCSKNEKQILKAEQALLELTEILYNNLVSRVPHANSAWNVKKTNCQNYGQNF